MSNLMRSCSAHLCSAMTLSASRTKAARLLARMVLASTFLTLAACGLKGKLERPTSEPPEQQKQERY